MCDTCFDFVIDPAIFDGIDFSSNPEDDEEDSGRAEYEAYKQRRMNQCRTMTVMGKENLTTGRRSFQTNSCGFADCPDCGPAIMKWTQNEIENELKNGALKKHSVYSEQERAKVARKYGKDNFRCYPVETEEGIRYDFLIKTDDEIGEVYDKVKNEDVELWSRKVYKQKQSGNLCKLEKKAGVSGSDDIIDERRPIEAENYVIDFGVKEENLKLCHACEEITVHETNYLNPKTFEELEAALIIRRAKFAEVIEKSGGVILHVIRRIVLVRESDIDWHRPPKNKFQL